MTVQAGFYGKIPCRGDFVRGGLPGDLLRPLDAWWQDVLAGSRALLGEAAWTEIWMEAPIWHFTLPPGSCGPWAAAGLWLPSTDRVGRLFPLTLMICAPDWPALAPLGGFLPAAEAIGLRAVEQDVPPEDIGAALHGALAAAPATPLPPPGAWWTAGSRLVAPARRRFDALPDAGAFAAMLRD